MLHALGQRHDDRGHLGGLRPSRKEPGQPGRDPIGVLYRHGMAVGTPRAPAEAPGSVSSVVGGIAMQGFENAGIWGAS